MLEMARNAAREAVRMWSRGAGACNAVNDGMNFVVIL
jgi:hypothetical protein